MENNDFVEDIAYNIMQPIVEILQNYYASHFRYFEILLFFYILFALTFLINTYLMRKEKIYIFILKHCLTSLIELQFVQYINSMNIYLCLFFFFIIKHVLTLSQEISSLKSMEQECC